MKNQQGFETVKVAGGVEKLVQTVICIVSALVATISATGLANGIHDRQYLLATGWAIAMVAAFSILVRFVVFWGESSKVE